MLPWQELCGWAATILFAGCYVPQIVKTFKTNKVEDVSLGQWVLQFIGYACALFYGIYLREAVLISGYAWGFLSSVLFLILYYRAKRRLK